MISKSKLCAIAFIAAASLASPAFAASSGPYGPGYTGGGSAGYNHHMSTDYRLKHHAPHGKIHMTHEPSTTK